MLFFNIKGFLRVNYVNCYEYGLSKKNFITLLFGIECENLVSLD